MHHIGWAAAIVLATTGISAGVGQSAAAELIPTLPCALMTTSKNAASASFCIEVYNACNTPLTTTVRDATTGEQRDTPEVHAGDRGEFCGPHPLELVGHTLGGP